MKKSTNPKILVAPVWIPVSLARGKKKMSKENHKMQMVKTGFFPNFPPAQLTTGKKNRATISKIPIKYPAISSLTPIT